jgi:hypothetical protein
MGQSVPASIVRPSRVLDNPSVFRPSIVMLFQFVLKIPRCFFFQGIAIRPCELTHSTVTCGGLKR